MGHYRLGAAPVSPSSDCAARASIQTQAVDSPVGVGSHESVPVSRREECPIGTQPIFGPQNTLSKKRLIALQVLLPINFLCHWRLV